MRRAADIRAGGIPLPGRRTVAVMATNTFTVSGMTCTHCVASVTEELQELDGVHAVAVDLPTGAVTVTSTARLEVGAVREAVETAGYQLVG